MKKAWIIFSGTTRTVECVTVRQTVNLIILDRRLCVSEKKSLSTYSFQYLNENVNDNKVKGQTVMHEVHMWGWITMWVPPNPTELKGSQHPV